MFKVGDITVGNGKLFLISGPCVVESELMVLKTAERLKSLAARFEFPLIFKASYRKANRLSGSSFSGIGDQEALTILAKVKSKLGLPILSDIHEPSEADPAAEVCDVLQIPAFLSRQTDLITSAARTGKVVNIKKGQFLSPEDMSHSAQKVVECGNSKVLLTERGTSFGYRDLIVDFRSLVTMKETGHPVVFDATHSNQQPGGRGGSSGGNREFVFPLTRAALAVGIDGLFFETHPDPTHAKSDAATQMPLDQVETYLEEVKRYAEA